MRLPLEEKLVVKIVRLVRSCKGNSRPFAEVRRPTPGGQNLTPKLPFCRSPVEQPREHTSAQSVPSFVRTARRERPDRNQLSSSRIHPATRSPITMQVKFVFARGIVGITEASAMRRPEVPWTLPC
jgi:hypothetical protein